MQGEIQKALAHLYLLIVITAGALWPLQIGGAERQDLSIPKEEVKQHSHRSGVVLGLCEFDNTPQNFSDIAFKSGRRDLCPWFCGLL